MARKIQHSVRWEGWIANAIDAWAEENGKKTFSESVNYLLAVELERWGYKREKYEPGIKETPLEREKKLAAEKKDAEITAQTLRQKRNIEQAKKDQELAIQKAIQQEGLTEEEAEVLWEKSSKKSFMAFHPTLEADLIKRRRGNAMESPSNCEKGNNFQPGIGPKPESGETGS